MQEMTGIEARDWVLDGKSLPDNLVVKGDLDLFGCTALTSLPDNLVVNGELDLSYCTALTSLPDNLVVSGNLYLTGCTALTSLPDNLVVKGSLNLGGCTSLTALPDNLVVKVGLYLTSCTALTSLPDNLVVNGSLYLWGFTNLTSSVRWLFPKSSVKCEYPPIGYIQDDGTLLIRAGCFSGNLEEARIRSNGRSEYLTAIDDIEEEWKAQLHQQIKI